MKRKILKNLALILALFVLLVSAGGCKQKSNSNEKISSSAKQTGVQTTQSTKSTKTTNISQSTNTGNMYSTTKNPENVAYSADDQAISGDSADISDNSSVQVQGSSDEGSKAQFVVTEDKIDFGGRNFRIFTKQRIVDEIVEGSPFPHREALYYNLKEAEKKYNFKTEFITSGDLVQNILAGIEFCDVVVEVQNIFPSYVTRNIIMPVDDYIDFNNNPICTEPNFYTSGLWMGKHYGWNPWGSPRLGLAYNRELFDREGLPDIHDIEDIGQWTWDKFLELAQNATRDINGDGVIEQYGVAGDSRSILQAFLFSNDGRYVDDVNGRLIFAMDRPNSLVALQFVSDLFNVYKVVGPTSEFTKGNVAMRVMEGWAVENCKKENMADVGFAIMPKGPNVTDFVQINDTMVLDVFPSNLSEPEKVIKAWFDISTVHDPAKEHHVTVEQYQRLTAEKYLYNERDIQDYLKMREKQKVIQTRGLTDLNNIVNKEFFDKIVTNSVTVSAGIEQIKSACQAAIDNAMGQ